MTRSPLSTAMLPLLLLFVPSLRAQFTETETLIPTNHSWEWMHYTTPGGTFVDPDTVNPAFDATWFTAGYSENPPFNAAAPAPLGYGVIDGAPIVTDIGIPPSDTRRATPYFRTTFTPTTNVTGLRFEGIIDDACVVYVNGQEVARFNLDDSPDRWGLTAESFVNEDLPIELNVIEGIFLPADTPATLHVSLHNWPGSSDLGLSLRVAALEIPNAAPNDDFANAIDLSGPPLPINTSGRSDVVSGSPSGATLEVGEPFHAGEAGGASVWFRWTADSTGVAEVSVENAEFPHLIGLYSGNSLDTLTEVGSARGRSAGMPVVAGTTYHIAIDGSGGATGLFGLAISSIVVPFSVSEVLLTRGSDWEHLMLVDGDGAQVDPGGGDPDFDTTWQTAAGYNGPAFQGPNNAMFAYNDINFGLPATLLQPTPDSGSRRTVYFRTTITPSAEISRLGFQGLIDDGAIIYLGGTEVARINMGPQPDDYLLFSAGDGNENTLSIAESTLPLSFPAGVPVEVAVSVHQSGTGSSDLGFDLSVFSLPSPQSTPPPNDNFADGQSIPGAAVSLPAIVIGRTHDTQGSIGASREIGEPLHAANAGGGSIWYRWTPDTNGTYSVSTDGSSFNTLLAIYTGSVVNGLTEVASANETLFYAAEHIVFNATAGTTYHIAVDGFFNGTSTAFGNTELTIRAFVGLPLPIESVLVPAGAPWEHLLYTNAAQIPVDPTTANANFNSTWFTDAYSGVPAFQGPSPGMLGYGTIDADPIVTDIWNARDGSSIPPNGQRYAAYFRTIFTPATDVNTLGFEGVIDDGAIVYVNGVEVARMHMPSGPDTFDLRAPLVLTESSPQFAVAEGVNLPAGEPVLVAVSVHNNTFSSSDLGFNLAIYDLLVGQPEAFEATLARIPGGGIEISWNSVPTELYDVEFSIDLVNWVAVFEAVAGAGSTTSVQHESGTTRGWYRVVRL